MGLQSSDYCRACYGTPIDAPKGLVDTFSSATGCLTVLFSQNYARVTVVRKSYGVPNTVDLELLRLNYSTLSVNVPLWS